MIKWPLDYDKPSKTIFDKGAEAVDKDHRGEI